MTKPTASAFKDFCFNRYWAGIAILQGLNTVVRGAAAPNWLLHITMKRACRRAGLPYSEPAKADRNSILSPFEQRRYGVVIITQGLSTLLLGSKAPNLQLAWIMDKAMQRERRQQVVA